MTLLQEMSGERMRCRENLRADTLRRLRMVLSDVLPEEPVIVFGSLVEAGAFSDVSDVDLALWREPPGMTMYRLTSLLAERLGRQVDVVLLPECRFRERILRQGETWMPQD